jgi:hypothetical protein
MKKRPILLSLLTLVAMAGLAQAQTASVQVIHNSPDPLATAVDVYLDGGLAIDDFAFRTATPVLSLPAEVQIVIGIAPGNSTGPADILASFPVTLMAGGSYVVMATGVLDPSLPGNPEGLDTAFTLKIFAPLTTSAPAGQVALLAYHGAPDAPAVDILADGVGVLVPDLSYGDFAGYLTVPAADYVLRVTPAGDNGTVVASFVAPLSGFGGGAAVVFASGFLTSRPGNSFGLFAALTNGEVLQLVAPDVAVESATWSGLKALFE